MNKLKFVSKRTNNRTLIPYPCEYCSAVIFCSRKCQQHSCDSFHRYECPITKNLYASGASVTVLMALRIITQENADFFINLNPILLESKEQIKRFRGSDYMSVYHLVRHDTQRTAEDFFERTAMAVFLLKLLKKADYFNKRQDSEHELYIGSLILRHLQLLQFNAHEIFELETDCLDTFKNFKTVFIGGGLFPTLSLFNHSCNPGVVRYFNGKTVIVRTIRTIESQDFISENYGPMFTVNAREERRQKLKSQYWFDCTCDACEENWPTVVEMDRSVFRFKCDANGNAKCNAVLLVPQMTPDFMIKCPACKQYTNIFKGLKVLQDTEAMFRQASIDMNKGNFQAGLDIYLEILQILDHHLAPPFPDYHICQEAIRKCMLSFGNKYLKLPI